MSQIACVSHCVGLRLEHYYFFIRFMLKSRVCPTVWVWALLFYVFFVSNRVPLCGFENCFYSFFYAIAKMLNSPFSQAKFWGVDWPPRPPSNTANMYRKISAVIMALQGVAGGDRHPKILPEKRENFRFSQFLKTLPTTLLTLNHYSYSETYNFTWLNKIF